MRRISAVIRERSRALRQPQTPTEQALWRILSGRQAQGYKFRRQHPIGQFIVDFYCPVARLVVEIDGDSHAEQGEYDQTRTDWLESQGLHVIRFANRDVKENISGVLERILEYCIKT